MANPARNGTNPEPDSEADKSEFERFEALTKLLVNSPKAKADKGTRRKPKRRTSA